MSAASCTACQPSALLTQSQAAVVAVLLFDALSRHLSVWSCAGVVDVANRSGSVELKRYPRSHPFAQLSGSDNIIAFTTQRYAAQPLIVR